jgi:hypothetical protein
MGSDDEEGENNDIDRHLDKAKHFVAIVEEVKLKRKLTLKRSLNLCLILLKQCRADVNDRNLVDICSTLI